MMNIPVSQFSQSLTALFSRYAQRALDPRAKQLILCALNAIYLAGKCFASIPSFVTNCAYCGRCLYPLLEILSSIEMCVKSVQDVHAVYQARAWSVLPWSAISLFVNVSALLLSIGSGVAGISLAYSYSTFAARLFTVLIPWGKYAFLMGFFRDVLTLLPDQQTMEAFSSGASIESLSSTSTAYLYLRTRLDARSWREWKGTPDARKACEMLRAVSFYSIMENMQAMLYYPANWLVKCYPNSRLEALIYLAFSLNTLRNQMVQANALAASS